MKIRFNFKIAEVTLFQLKHSGLCTNPKESEGKLLQNK